jgi:hypothetical protein
MPECVKLLWDTWKSLFKALWKVSSVWPQYGKKSEWPTSGMETLFSYRISQKFVTIYIFEKASL